MNNSFSRAQAKHDSQLPPDSEPQLMHCTSCGANNSEDDCPDNECPECGGLVEVAEFEEDFDEGEDALDYDNPADDFVN